MPCRRLVQLVGYRHYQRAEDAQGGRLGRRGPASVDGAQHDHDDDEHRDDGQQPQRRFFNHPQPLARCLAVGQRRAAPAIGGSLHRIGEPGLGRLLLLHCSLLLIRVTSDPNAVEPPAIESAHFFVHRRRPGNHHRRDDHHQHHRERQQEPGQEPAHVQPANGFLHQHSEDDQPDAGRNQNAQRAPGRQRPDDQPLAVPALPERWQRHAADSGGGGHAGTGAGRENRAGRDVGVQQSARQEHQPAGQRPVHALAHAGAQHQLAHQQEQRHRHQNEVGVALPGFVAQDVPQVGVGKRLHHHQRKYPQGAGDV